MLVLAYQWSRYLHTLHENDLWFSEIMVSIHIIASPHC